MNFIAYPTYPTNRTNTIPTPRTSSKRQKKKHRPSVVGHQSHSNVVSEKNASNQGGVCDANACFSFSITNCAHAGVILPAIGL
jgi:hypothetical protein